MIVKPALLGLFAGIFVVAGITEEPSPPLFDILSIFRYLLPSRGEPSPSPNVEKGEKPQSILVIGAGFGRTGTASFVSALHRLGLKSYHMKEGILDTPGHLDLWHLHAKQKLAGKPGIVDEILDRIASDGFNATVDEPVCFYYKELMERYPSARVVLTVRGDGDGQAWAESMLNTVGQAAAVFKRIPYRWIPFTRKRLLMIRYWRAKQGAPIDETTGLPTRQDLVSAYETWNQHVQTTVPTDRLLVFAAKNGWKPLCDFLSPIQESIETACQQVLDSGEPYPQVNDSASMQNLFRFLGGVARACEILPTLLAVSVLVWMGRQRYLAKNKTE